MADKKLTALQERNYKAMLYLNKVNPDRYELGYKEGELTLTEFAQIGESYVFRCPFKDYTLNTK